MVTRSHTPRHLDTAGALGLLRPDAYVFVQGMASEPAAFREALVAEPHHARAVHFTGALAPGINDFDYAALHPEARFTGLFLATAHDASRRAGRARYLPMHYSAAYRYFAEQAFDLAVLHVAPPDDQGNCSLGVTADFGAVVVPRARAVLAYVNAAMPRTLGPSIPWDQLSAIVEIDRALPTFDTAPASDGQSLAIAAHVASLVKDGDCVQLGIGKLPGAVARALAPRRDLTIHSGMITDAVLDLLEAGALREGASIVTGSAIGSARLYAAVADPRFVFHSVAHTHAASVVASIPSFVSINSAIEVDLLGQVNSERIGERHVSGIGGAVDFVRGAAQSSGGRSIIALPSTTPSGKSRIVTRIAAGLPITIARSDTAIVVTEHGIADLRGLTEQGRVRALAAIAHPDARDALLAEAVA